MEALDVLWITAGLGCDGDTIALTGATQPSLEDLVLGVFPGVPPVRLHNPVLAYTTGDDFLAPFWKATRDELGPFLLVLEGSVPNEEIKEEGYWAAMGVDPETGQPMPTCRWLDLLAPRAWGVVAVGTCAAYGGIHAMAGNPTGAMGLCDYLGHDFASVGGLPVVNIAGCPVQPDNLTETLLYLLRQYAGHAPMIPLDDVNRPLWMFEQMLHETCDRGGYYEQGEFADELGQKQCIVKHGCWGPVVRCNVGKRGWMGGVGGCPNVGGVCIGCTMPGFPDKFQPFLDQPPGSLLSAAAVENYGRAVATLRRFTSASLEREPPWRAPGSELKTGYQAPWRGPVEDS